MTLPDQLPLFPLSNVVLFPDVFLPLHIFEERYRAMTRDALAGQALIGMTVLREGWQRDYEGTPPIYATGCAGTIVHHERLQDGRYNIVLKGVARFEVERELETGAPYRVAQVRWHAETDAEGTRPAVTRVRRQVETLLLPAVARGEVRLPTELSDQALVNAVCQAIDVPIVEKLALLEKPDVVTRGLALLPILERLLIRLSGSGQVH
ncbi:ATP-dependent protease [Luteitalea sp. TBR-22]|uniref:LON peptidase substrate-binding domain-containing protein n=1 Tax=Luteitalea sp. TBR-22 TaxID=2802971 RepID=UPI001AF113B9|nr:LON peptidase substrate-binding domain-containing protein [Luteitalea sp. TBR-22]BCS34454.1 ATP-dependent protease [Luteitalea sp. TBR-22]